MKKISLLLSLVFVASGSLLMGCGSDETHADPALEKAALEQRMAQRPGQAPAGKPGSNPTAAPTAAPGTTPGK
jgi:hypothetical protein